MCPDHCLRRDAHQPQHERNSGHRPRSRSGGRATQLQRSFGARALTSIVWRPGSTRPLLRGTREWTTLTHPFTRCVLATGAEPVRPPVPGADHPDVRCLRSLTSSRELRAAAGPARSTVVVGAGFIGCEAAVSLARSGVQVTVLCPDSVPQQKRLGRDAGELILHWLKTEGVGVLRETRLRSITEGHREHLRTSRPDVYAAGDVAWAHNPSAGRALAVEHRSEGLAMGEVAGRSAAGVAVGVLTHNADDDYERGAELIREHRPVPSR
ncbi:FAD-dependent oxidoreductase [Amycolatopsis sp. NPDC001319]|uniref:FAD-dependent oxidoreductase n=1 Tax=unclassified Amycolatopsis TaxID=2618356 RepID=UPI0036A043D1